MKYDILKKIVQLKKEKKEFSIITDLNDASNFIYLPTQNMAVELQPYIDQIKLAYKNRSNGIIANTSFFIDNYHLPIKVFIVGAVHIAQYFCEFAKHLNFETIVIDPRGYFASDKRFPDTKVISKWPSEAFQEIALTDRSALIALTHDPKIDDPAIKEALQQKCFYIGALGSKKTHQNRIDRLKESGFSEEQVKSIHGPIGINLGGRSASEIALSIIAQLVSKVYNIK